MADAVVAAAVAVVAAALALVWLLQLLLLQLWLLQLSGGGFCRCCCGCSSRNIHRISKLGQDTEATYFTLKGFDYVRAHARAQLVKMIMGFTQKVNFLVSVFPLFTPL